MSLRDIFLALMTILIWSGNFIAIKVGVAEMPPLVFLTLRLVLTALVFLPFVKWPDKRQARILIEISLYMWIIHQGLLLFAMRILDVSTGSILLQSQTLFAALLGWLILGEVLHRRIIVGLAVGFSGLVITLGAPDLQQNPAGFGIALLSALAIAFSYIRMRQLREVHPPTFIVMTMGAAIPVAFIASLLVSPQGWAHLPDADWVKMGVIFFYQVLAVSVSHILWQSLLARNKVATVASFVLLMPVMSIFLSAVFLGEEIGLALIGGGMLTLAGVALVTLRRIKKQPVEADTML